MRGLVASKVTGASVDARRQPAPPRDIAAKNATATIPIVMATAGDPVQTGLVASLAHPGGNVTGNSIITTDLASKKVGLLHEFKPGTRRLGHLGDKQIAPDQLAFRETQSAASALGMEATFFNAPVFYTAIPDIFERAFAAMAAAKVDVVFVSESYVEARNQIVELAAQYRLPAVYGRREFVDAGGLLSYGANAVSTSLASIRSCS